MTIDNVCAREERSCSEEVRLRFKGLTICTSKWICGLAPAPVLANSLLLDVRLASSIRNSESPEAQKALTRVRTWALGNDDFVVTAQS